MGRGMRGEGGGSTTMVVDGAVINAPSDATGERPVGDALAVLPPRRSSCFLNPPLSGGDRL
jgi:hypothetical protein